MARGGRGRFRCAGCRALNGSAQPVIVLLHPCRCIGAQRCAVISRGMGYAIEQVDSFFSNDAPNGGAAPVNAQAPEAGATARWQR